MTIHKMVEMELKPGELIVSMVSHQYYIVIVTDRGTIYKINIEDRI